jgi:hypothetical protein
MFFVHSGHFAIGSTLAVRFDCLSNMASRYRFHPRKLSG